ncbi:MAG: DUF177 domain-containing protein [Alphaproteobacteria bacterium]|nr:DUF177 domain-containing protein [Alphaproteobacteria bacterium]
MSAANRSQRGEFERIVKLDRLPREPLKLAAEEAERAALASRFGIEAVHSLEAELGFAPEGRIVVATGRLTAKIEQLCAVSGEPFRNRIDEPLALRFVPASEQPEFEPEEEIELDTAEPDEIYYEGQSFDLGEAIAQSLGLAIDPYAEGPEAAATREKAGLLDVAPNGPFAALAALKRD